GWRMAGEWSSSEKLRLLILHKNGVDWAASAEKMNEEYRERQKNFFNEKKCKAEFDRICNEACPKPITPEEPSQSFKKTTVVDSWITHFKEQVRLDSDKMVEYALVDMRKQAALIERIMSKNDRPSSQEMSAMLATLREQNKKSNRDPAQTERIERVESVLRARFNQIFKEQRDSDGNDVSIPPGSLSISPTKVSSVALQQAFRSPSPIKSPMTSPIRPLAEAIEEADAEMVEMGETLEEPKVELDTPVGSPLSKAPSSTGKRNQEKSSTVSPRTAVDRAIGNGGLEEEMEEEDDEEEVVKEEPMEVEESVVEKKDEKPTRKSTRVSTTSVETTPVSSGKERRRRDPSPHSSESSTSKKEKEKEELKEDEGRVRRSSMRGRSSLPTTPLASAATPPTPVQSVAVEGGKGGEEEKEEGTTKTRRSSRVERMEEKREEKEEEEEVTKRITRRSHVEKDGEKKEETKEEVTFVAPSVASRTRHHRGSEQVEEKEKSEEPSATKTRAGNRQSLNTKAVSESKESPIPNEKKGKRGEKKEEEIEEKEKDTRVRKETSVALSEKSLGGVGGKRDAEMLTEVSIRHHLSSSHPISPAKNRRGTERESPSTPVGRKSSRVSSASSNSGKRESLMASVEVQTEKVEMRHDDEVFVLYDSNERPFTAVFDLEKGKTKPRKEIKTETEEEKEKEKPISRRTRGGGEISEDEGGSRSGSFSQSEKGTPSRRKESKRDMMTLHLDVDDDTGRYWRAKGATSVDPIEDTPGPSSTKRSRALMAEISGRRSMNLTDPIKAALIKAIKDLELHRHSSVFKAHVPQKDAPDYYDCVNMPVCLSKLKQDVLDGIINDAVSLKRQFAIMFMNGAMFNSTAHDYWMYAVEMNKESWKPIRDIMPEMMLEDEGPKLTRARRNNEPAFAKDAVPCDRDRSMTLDRFFKCESVDTDGMDPPSDDHRVVYTRNKVDSTRKRKI
ncbi:hypothetical protein PENTCL1PPCAC_7025, partial [Pristionchus entomophagus]